MGPLDVLIYVLDAHALIALQDAAATAGFDFDDLLSKMTALVEDGQLVCPPSVVRECRDFGETDLITSWVRMASANFNDASVSWDIAEQVISSHPTLVDSTETRENPQVDVLGLAIQRKNRNHDVVIVTGQWVDTPICAALGTVAAAADVTAMTPMEFITTFII